jgi:hypothetical protein
MARRGALPHHWGAEEHVERVLFSQAPVSLHKERLQTVFPAKRKEIQQAERRFQEASVYRRMLQLEQRYLQQAGRLMLLPARCPAPTRMRPPHRPVEPIALLRAESQEAGGAPLNQEKGYYSK